MNFFSILLLWVSTRIIYMMNSNFMAEREEMLKALSLNHALFPPHVQFYHFPIPADLWISHLLKFHTLKNELLYSFCTLELRGYIYFILDHYILESIVAR